MPVCRTPRAGLGPLVQPTEQRSVPRERSLRPLLQQTATNPYVENAIYAL